MRAAREKVLAIFPEESRRSINVYMVYVKQRQLGSTTTVNRDKVARRCQRDEFGLVAVVEIATDAHPIKHRLVGFVDSYQPGTTLRISSEFPKLDVILPSDRV